MREFIKRTAAMLATLILLTQLAACGGNTDDSASTGHYKISILSGMIQGVNDMALVDGTTYILAYDNSYNTGVYRLEMDTETLQLIYDSAGAVSIASDRQGGLWVLDSNYDEQTEEVSMFFTQLNTDGTAIKTKEIAVDLTITNFTNMVSDGDGNLYVNDGGKILLFDMGGEYIGEVDVSEYAAGLAVDANGEVMTYDTGEEAFCTVDGDTMAYGEIYSSDYSGEVSHKGLMDGNDVYDIYYYSSEGVYGCTTEDGTVSQVLDWQENDISQIFYCGMIDREHFLVYDTDLILLSYTEEEAEEKTTLTLASMEPSETLKTIVAQFNRGNNQYWIDLADYSEYNTENDESAGLTKLNTEIIAGDGPDLIDLNGLPMQQYVEKGILLEIGSLFDGDEGISRDDYVESILSSLEIGGKLYSITPGFYISTVLGRTSQVGSDMGWTYESFRALLNETGSTAFANLTCYEVLEQLFEANQGLFVDLENSTCDFTTGSFVQLLEMAAEYPQEIDTTNYTSSVIQLERAFL